jgi:prepilin-type N-terminal cleavage/methylation domain-containing protein
MNTRPQRRSAGEHGFTLIELLVYMAVFVVVVGCATKTFYDCWDNTKALRRNADEIARALDVGERWRADVREATGAARLKVTNGAEQFRIAGVAGEVTYTFANGEIRRQAGATAPNSLWLSNIKSSQMRSDARGHVSAWRWELELISGRRQPRLRPLFTFECAAPSAPSQ